MSQSVLCLSKFTHHIDSLFKSVAMKRMKEYFELMLAFAGCMRSSLIHPVIPGGGRDLTVLFSPTRKESSSILKSLERRNRCVCCRRQIKPTDKQNSKKRSDNLDNLEDQNINDEDDDQFIANDEEDEGEEAGGFGSFKGTGNIDPLPDTICTTAGLGIRHYACESCLNSLKETGARCPLCKLPKEIVCVTVAFCVVELTTT